MDGVGELELLRGGVPVETLTVQGRLVLGRSPSSDVVLVDDDISKHHAVLSLEGGALRVADLRSTNGTFVNDQPVVDDRVLAPGDEVRLGPNVVLRVVRVPRAADRPLPVVHDVSAGIRYSFDTDRMRIGAGPDCAIRVSGAPRPATLLIDPDGVVWLGVDGEEVPVGPGESFEVGGRRLVLEVVERAGAPTLKTAVSTRYPYRVVASLDGPRGAVATISHLQRGLEHTFGSENRAVLLYLLARRLRADRAAGRDERAAGWCQDGEILVGVWGRASADQAASALNVLVHRTRKELEELGFDPWCIEKRRGAVRLRVDQVDLAG